jgi:hypothetical protein
VIKLPFTMIHGEPSEERLEDGELSLAKIAYPLRNIHTPKGV